MPNKKQNKFWLLVVIAGALMAAIIIGRVPDIRESRFLTAREKNIVIDLDKINIKEDNQGNVLYYYKAKITLLDGEEINIPGSVIRKDAYGNPDYSNIPPSINLSDKNIILIPVKLTTTIREVEEMLREYVQDYVKELIIDKKPGEEPASFPFAPPLIESGGLLSQEERIEIQRLEDLLQINRMILELLPEEKTNFTKERIRYYEEQILKLKASKESPLSELETSETFPPKLFEPACPVRPKTKDQRPKPKPDSQTQSSDASLLNNIFESLQGARQNISNVLSGVREKESELGRTLAPLDALREEIKRLRREGGFGSAIAIGIKEAELTAKEKIFGVHRQAFRLVRTIRLGLEGIEEEIKLLEEKLLEKVKDNCNCQLNSKGKQEINSHLSKINTYLKSVKEAIAGLLSHGLIRTAMGNENIKELRGVLFDINDYIKTVAKYKSKISNL